MDFYNSWYIEFLINTRSLQGKLQVEDLRELISAKIPASHEAFDEKSIGYTLYWDYAIQEEPNVHFLQPYISWTDPIALKPGSFISVYGQKIPISLALIHGNTMNHINGIQRRALEMKKIPMPTDTKADQIFFSVSKRDSEGPADPVFKRLSQQLIPLT